MLVYLLGKSIHSNKYKPWILINYIAFVHEVTVKAFEKYLKHHLVVHLQKKDFITPTFQIIFKIICF
jgi:hypothetical protein